MTSSLNFTSYVAPGVYSQVIPGPQVGTNSTGPSGVAIFGDSLGYQTNTQTIVIPADSGGSPVPSVYLSQTGINTSTVVVTNLTTNAVYVVTTNGTNNDYKIIATTGPSGVPNGPDASYQLERISTGNLAAGTSVQVSYQYTNTTYFLPTTFYSYANVSSAYGAPFDVNGNIISPLTLACYFAFLNGATQVIAVAIQPSMSPPALQDYVNALAALDSLDNVSIIVPAYGNSNIFSYVQSHVDAQSLTAHERRAILGLDGSVTAVNSASRISAAEALGDTRVALVSPATVNYFNTTTNTNQVLGGQYVAAAVAGIAISQIPSVPLTRKLLTGFGPIAETVAETQKNVEAADGLMVIENTNQGTVRIRHGVTTNPTSLITREWTITGQQDAMIYQIRNILDNDGLIGSVITNLTLSNIQASAITALEALVSNSTIYGYDSVSVSQLATTPDVVQVTFEWQPSLPLNYIVASFSINITTGSIASTTPVSTTG
jgi:hypothetical protein